MAQGATKSLSASLVAYLFTSEWVFLPWFLPALQFTKSVEQSSGFSSCAASCAKRASWQKTTAGARVRAINHVIGLIPAATRCVCVCFYARVSMRIIPTKSLNLKRHKHPTTDPKPFPSSMCLAHAVFACQSAGSLLVRLGEVSWGF